MININNKIICKIFILIIEEINNKSDKIFNKY